VSLVLDLVPLVDHSVFVDTSTFLRDRSVLVDVKVHDVVLVELLRPSVRNSVLNLILDSLLVGTFGKSMRQGLLMKLVKLVVELGDHCLNVGVLFLCIQFGIDSGLDIGLRVHSVLQVSSEGFFHEHLSNLNLAILAQQAQVPLVDLLKNAFINQVSLRLVVRVGVHMRAEALRVKVTSVKRKARIGSLTRREVQGFGLWMRHVATAHNFDLEARVARLCGIRVANFVEGHTILILHTFLIRERIWHNLAITRLLLL